MHSKCPALNKTNEGWKTSDLLRPWVSHLHAAEAVCPLLMQAPYRSAGFPGTINSEPSSLSLSRQGD